MRAPAKSFTDLEVWKKAHAFVLGVYRLTATFPEAERFGLTNQFRRAAVSIPANIAEGFRKYTTADKARFLNTAEGSAEECLLLHARSGSWLWRHNESSGGAGRDCRTASSLHSRAAGVVGGGGEGILASRFSLRASAPWGGDSCSALHASRFEVT